MKILITGAAGYLGSHTKYMFNELGYEVIGVDRFSSPEKKLLRKNNDIVANIMDSKKIDEIMAKFEPDIVIHLAALSGVAVCKEFPELCTEINVEGTKVILEAMARNKVKNIVFASSSAVYSQSSSALSEDSTLSANNEYAQSKLAAEKLISEYQERGINSVILRIFNLAGMGTENKFNEIISKDSHLLPKAIKAALYNQTLSIYGDNYNTIDGTAVRDYVHISDVTEALKLACEFLVNGNNSEIFNIASGVPISVKELCDVVEKYTRKKIDISVKNADKYENPYILANASKAKKLLGWKPLSSDIENIVKTAINWQLMN